MIQDPISVQQARALIAASVIPVPAVKKYIADATGLTIAEDIFSQLDIPAFNQSSMDGYAIYAEDISETLSVQGVIRAGDKDPAVLRRKHAMRIYTGAQLPEAADTIVMQEKVETEGGSIRILEHTVEKGTHVRKMGSELQKDELVVKNGTSISAPVIGLLASIGVTEIKVYDRIKISVIATGNELQKPGEPLESGQNYESNVFFLSAALRPYISDTLGVSYADDNLASIQELISAAVHESDVVLLTGGISVGDYDFVRNAADNNNIHCKFHRVKQKPGKPLYFGTKENKLVFGLPGNPASVITCFYEYVLPAIRFMMQLPQEETANAILKNEFKKAHGLTQFLKGFADEGEVEILEAQESYRLRSFALANCLVHLDEQKEHYEKGEEVTIRFIPK